MLIELLIEFSGLGPRYIDKVECGSLMFRLDYSWPAWGRGGAKINGRGLGMGSLAASREVEKNKTTCCCMAEIDKTKDTKNKFMSKDEEFGHAAAAAFSCCCTIESIK